MSRHVRLESPVEGGHVGFFTDGGSGDHWYLRERIFAFFEKGA
ncbi:hypothetical protein SBBP1_720001 [Burkholderiales bacterium]|nr:hypothetical protein SBBP1_720001 [Burkholderiales bacterium]